MEAPVAIAHFISSWPSLFSASLPYHPSLFSYDIKNFPLPFFSTPERTSQDPQLNTCYELYPPCVGTMSIKCTFYKQR
jgi:hypothetical protein